MLLEIRWPNSCTVFQNYRCLLIFRCKLKWLWMSQLERANFGLELKAIYFYRTGILWRRTQWNAKQSISMTHKCSEYFLLFNSANCFSIMWIGLSQPQTLSIRTVKLIQLDPILRNRETKQKSWNSIRRNDHIKPWFHYPYNSRISVDICQGFASNSGIAGFISANYPNNTSAPIRCGENPWKYTNSGIGTSIDQINAAKWREVLCFREFLLVNERNYRKLYMRPFIHWQTGKNWESEWLRDWLFVFFF